MSETCLRLSLLDMRGSELKPEEVEVRWQGPPRILQSRQREPVRFYLVVSHRDTVVLQQYLATNVRPLNIVAGCLVS
jgi:hypothetical protein